MPIHTPFQEERDRIEAMRIARLRAEDGYLVEEKQGLMKIQRVFRTWNTERKRRIELNESLVSERKKVDESTAQYEGVCVLCTVVPFLMAPLHQDPGSTGGAHKVQQVIQAFHPHAEKAGLVVVGEVQETRSELVRAPACDTVWTLLNAFACLHCNRYEAIHEQLKELADAHQAGANTAEAATKHREDLEASLQPVDKKKKRQRLYASTYGPHRC